MESYTLGKWIFIELRFEASLFLRVIWEISGKWFTRLGYYSERISLMDRSWSVQRKVKWSTPNWNSSSLTATSLMMGYCVPSLEKNYFIKIHLHLPSRLMIFLLFFIDRRTWLCGLSISMLKKKLMCTFIFDLFVWDYIKSKLVSRSDCGKLNLWVKNMIWE